MKKTQRHVCFNPLCPCLNAKWNPTFNKEIFGEKQNCLKNGSIYKKTRGLPKKETLKN